MVAVGDGVGVGLGDTVGIGVAVGVAVGIGVGLVRGRTVATGTTGVAACWLCQKRNPTAARMTTTPATRIHIRYELRCLAMLTPAVSGTIWIGVSAVGAGAGLSGVAVASGAAGVGVGVIRGVSSAIYRSIFHRRNNVVKGEKYLGPREKNPPAPWVAWVNPSNPAVRRDGAGCLGRSYGGRVCPSIPPALTAA